MLMTKYIISAFVLFCFYSHSEEHSCMLDGRISKVGAMKFISVVDGRAFDGVSDDGIFEHLSLNYNNTKEKELNEHDSSIQYHVKFNGEKLKIEYISSIQHDKNSLLCAELSDDDKLIRLFTNSSVVNEVAKINKTSDVEVKFSSYDGGLVLYVLFNEGVAIKMKYINLGYDG